MKRQSAHRSWRVVRWRVGLVALLVAAACSRAVVPLPGRASAAPAARPYVLLISFDGFRHDYLDRGLTPHFERLAARGVRADALIPVFPTKTYPNHYSIATGLYAGRHGLIGNEFHDPAWDAEFTMRDRTTVEDGRWYGGEPIWVTAEKQGVLSAAMFFIGTEAPVQGIQPTYWTRYEHELPIDVRLGRVLEWLALPRERRPHMITLYFPMLDDTAHGAGPDSPETDRTLHRMDAVLGQLLGGIAQLPHGDSVNVVIVSDHGMAEVEGSIVLDEHADLDGVVTVASSTYASLFFRGDTVRRDAVLEQLRAAPHVRAFRRAEIPADWHVRENARIGDVLVVADEGWLLTRRGRPAERNRATHGWAPSRAMSGIFVAAGPGVRPGVRLPAFEAVHVYPFLAALLGLEPAADIDGRAEVLAPALATVPRGTR